MSTAPSMLTPPHIGRPRKLHDIADFELEIEAYFAGRDAAEKPYTMHGLARHLDCSRNTLLRYEEYDDAEPFCLAIKRARERIAEWTEDRLHQKGYHPAGAIFSLKNNFGWRDEQQVSVQVGVAVGIQASDEQRRAMVPAVQIAQISNENGDRPPLSIEAAREELSPQSPVGVERNPPFAPDLSPPAEAKVSP